MTQIHSIVNVALDKVVELEDVGASTEDAVKVVSDALYLDEDEVQELVEKVEIFNQEVDDEDT